MEETSMNSVYAEDIHTLVTADFPWKLLAGKTVLITGAGGFIASFLTQVLLAAGREHRLGLSVLALVRDRPKAERRFSHYMGAGGGTGEGAGNDAHGSAAKCTADGAAGLRLIVQDVTQPLGPETGRVDLIIHAASPASPVNFRDNPVGTILPNVTGTANLLEYARTHGTAGFVFISSSEVYGRPRGRGRVAENGHGRLDPLDPRSCYGESKRMGENMCLAWFTRYGVPVKIARLFHTYGPGMNLDDGRVFADFTANVVRHEPIAVKGNGKARRTFCYLTDTVGGLLTVLFKGKYGQAYNIGNDEAEISVKALARLLAGMFPEKKLGVIHTRRPERDAYLPSTLRRIRPDTTKIRELGWRPMVGLREGFYRTVRSFTNEPSA
jgi:UDP-glucuronate decarboxylase